MLKYKCDVRKELSNAEIGAEKMFLYMGWQCILKAKILGVIVMISVFLSRRIV